MVLGVRHDDADVGEQRGKLQIPSPLRLQLQLFFEFVEQHARQLCDVLRVLGAVVATIGELLHAASRRIVVFVELEHTLAAQGVEQESLAQCVVGEHERLQLEHVDETFEDQRTSEDDVGAVGLERESFRTFFHGRSRDERRDGGTHFVTAELEPIHRLGFARFAPALDDARDGLCRARRSRHDFEAELEHFGCHDRQRRPDERTTARHGTRMQRGSGEKPVGQTDCTELETAGEQHLVVKADDDLGRSAADVGDEHRSVMHADGVQHAEMDEPRFFHP